MIFNIFTGGGNGGWGYANLNFSIYRYGLEDTLPDTAEENTIVVFTDVEISSYIFDVNEPETPEDKMVWFSTNNTTSRAPFNVLKENGIYVYPLRAKQYDAVTSTWNSVEAKVFQNDKWTDLWYGNLFHHGDQYEDITGGWTSNPDLGGGQYWSTITFTNTINASGYTAASVFGGWAVTRNKIDLTNFNTLKVHFVSREGNQAIGVGETLDAHGRASSGYSSSIDENDIISCDLSKLEGKYYVYVINGANTGEFVVDRVWLE